MSFKKILLSALILSPLLLNSCNNSKENIKNIRGYNKEIAPTLSSILEKKAFSNSSKISLKTMRNNEYLSAFIKDKPNLQNKEHLIKKINKFIKSSEHTSVKPDTNYIFFYKTEELTLGQLQRVYLMFESLSDSSFLQEIGNIIEKDVEDKYAEHGGIVIFRKKKIYFKTLESNLEKDTSNNNLYGIPEESENTPSIGEFHLHASSYKEAKSANPSGSRDLIISDFTTQVDNESNEFLITPIKRGIFNMDYYGGHKTENPLIKVLDLGNYTYDTSKIFK